MIFTSFLRKLVSTSTTSIGKYTLKFARNKIWNYTSLGNRWLEYTWLQIYSNPYSLKIKPFFVCISLLSRISNSIIKHILIIYIINSEYIENKKCNALKYFLHWKPLRLYENKSVCDNISYNFYWPLHITVHSGQEFV